MIKTAEVESGRKVFINVCSSDRVAAPGGWVGGVMPDEVAQALEKLHVRRAMGWPGRQMGSGGGGGGGGAKGPRRGQARAGGGCAWRTRGGTGQ